MALRRRLKLDGEAFSVRDPITGRELVSLRLVGIAGKFADLEIKTFALDIHASEVKNAANLNPREHAGEN